MNVGKRPDEIRLSTTAYAQLIGIPIVCDPELPKGTLEIRWNDEDLSALVNLNDAIWAQGEPRE
jgi:hypothetical protein